MDQFALRFHPVQGRVVEDRQDNNDTLRRTGTTLYLGLGQTKVEPHDDYMKEPGM